MLRVFNVLHGFYVFRLLRMSPALEMLRIFPIAKLVTNNPSMLRDRHRSVKTNIDIGPCIGWSVSILA